MPRATSESWRRNVQAARRGEAGRAGADQEDMDVSDAVA
jgi:hypothetical protein